MCVSTSYTPTLYMACRQVGNITKQGQLSTILYSNNIEEHLGRMRYQRCWGTALEILAAASLLQMPIYTFTSAGSKQGRYRWVCYKPLVESALTWFPEDEPYPRKAFEMSHIELLYSGGCHYDCIVDQDGESPLAVPIHKGWSLQLALYSHLRPRSRILTGQIGP